MKRILFVVAFVVLALISAAGPALASDVTLMNVSTFAILDDDDEVNGLRRPYGFPVQTIPICHATGDPARPYDTPPTVVVIQVGGELEGGHSDHGGDIIPPY